MKLISLQGQLTQFGLNPNDWSLVRQAKNRYHIQAKTDKNFAFAGLTQIKKGKLAWQKLELISL